MREIAQDVARWLAGGRRDIAVATVLKTFGSAPRKEGAKLAYLSSGAICGSISGGCVESAILEEAAAAITSGVPKIIHFDTSDDDAWAVGLPCGGSIDVLVEPIDLEAFEAVRARVERNLWVTEVTVIGGAEAGSGGKLVLGDAPHPTGAFPRDLVAKAADIASTIESPRRVMLTPELELFVHPVAPEPTLVAVGGVHIAIALVAMARAAGFRTVVVDPRRTFGDAGRFPEVDRLYASWPSEAFKESPLSRDTAIVVLTHDPKLDDPALEAALSSDAFYIGALGSLRTQEKRRRRLLDRGYDERRLSRIHGPVGLDIGAKTPEQIAISILAEIVAVRNGRAARASL